MTRLETWLEILEKERGAEKQHRQSLIQSICSPDKQICTSDEGKCTSDRNENSVKFWINEAYAGTVEGRQPPSHATGAEEVQQRLLQ
jgi:hypothetical protein